MKKSAKSKTAAKYSAPKGYTVCDTGGMTAAVDWEKTPIVEGKVLEIKTIAEKKGKDKKGKMVVLRKETRLMILKKKDGSEVSVWEKKQLENLFDSVDEGSDVYIEHTGMQAIKGRALPMHVFTSAYK